MRSSCSVTTLVVVAATTVVSLASAQYNVSYFGNLQITMRDGITIVANAYVPSVAATSPDAFPLIICPSSWGDRTNEYAFQAQNFAEKGYATLEYEVRGWYRSGGEIDVLGPKDIHDAEDLVTYALSMGVQWHLDTSKVAFVGISQGAWISLLAAAHDVRVTTAVSLSGGNNLTQMAYDHETPNLVWGTLLDLLADIHGKPSAELKQLLPDVIGHNNMSWVRAYLEERSPQRFVASQYNKRNVPLFLSQNFLDRLFKPQHTITFFESLTSPKILLLNQGIHAEAEHSGLSQHGNYIWRKVRRWLDYFLKDVPTGILDEPKVQMQLTGDNYQLFPTWPVPANDSAVVHERYYLKPRGQNQFGSMTRSGPFADHAAAGSSSAHVPDVISFSTSPGLSDGLAVISDLLPPLQVDFSKVNPQFAIVYVSENANQYSDRICGTPRASVAFRAAAPGAPTPAHQWQIYFFLYSVSGTVGTLHSDGPFTHFDDREVAADPVTGIVTLSGISLHTTCVDIPAGRKIGFGIALYNELYSPVNTSAALAVEMVYGGNTFFEFVRVPR